MEIRTNYFYIQQHADLTDFTLGFEFSIVYKTGPLQFVFDFSIGKKKFRLNLHEKITWTK